MAMADPESLWEILNSEFVKSLTGSAMGALAGAGIGAYAAQVISERAKTRDDLVKEVRNINSTATMAYSIADAYLNLKRQHVKRLYDKYLAGKAALGEFRKIQAADPSAKFEFDAELLELALPPIPLAQIQHLVFERMTAPTKAIMMLSAVGNALSSLEDIFERRHAAIRELHATGVDPHNYFGLQKGNRTDLRYSSTMEGMYAYTDDMIYFSKSLGDDLIKYGRELKNRLPKRLHDTAPLIASVDYSNAADLLPDPEKYKSWETAIIKGLRPAGLHFWTATPPDQSF